MGLNFETKNIFPRSRNLREGFGANEDRAKTKETFYWVLFNIASGGGSDNITFKIPHDYTSIISAEIIGFSFANDATADYDFRSAYGAIGEIKDNHEENNIGTTYNVIGNILTSFNVANILTLISPNDYGTIQIDNNSANNLGIFGMRFRYT